MGTREAHLKEGFQQHNLGQPVPILPVDHRDIHTHQDDLGRDPTLASVVLPYDQILYEAYLVGLARTVSSRARKKTRELMAPPRWELVIGGGVSA